MNTPTQAPTPFPPSLLHRAEADARERVAAPPDPDEGWTFTSGKKIPRRPSHHRGRDTSPPFYARALRCGRDEWESGYSEADATRKLRARLGLPPATVKP